MIYVESLAINKNLYLHITANSPIDNMLHTLLYHKETLYKKHALDYFTLLANANKKCCKANT